MAGDAEGGRPVEEINNDIAAIDRLLRENKVKIASLQSAVAHSGKPICVSTIGKDDSGHERSYREEKRNCPAAGESHQDGRRGGDPDRAGGRAERAGRDPEHREDRTGEPAEYGVAIVGTEKELREAQITQQAGFHRAALTVNKTDNPASFTKSDSRLLSEVPIGQKKVSVTTHPEESYELVTDADKVVLKLLITDPVRFWESSKILIVSYK